MSREIDVGQVGQLDIELALCRPSSFVGEVLEAQFIGPHFDAAHTARIVAQTDHHRADVAQRRVALHADLVFRALRVVLIVEGGVGGQPLCAFAVTRLFDVRELLEVDVDHVVGRPHGTASRRPGVATFGRQHQRDFIFVEIVLIVRSESEEQTHLSVGQVLVARQRVGVHEELKVLVAAEVEVRVLIDGARIAASEVFDRERKGLFVVLQHLVLSRFDGAADAGGQDVVNGVFVVVFFEVHRAHHELAGRSCRHVLIKWLPVVAPLAAYETQRGETQHNRLVEACQEHAYEADRGEVADAAELAFVFAQRNAEQIPFRGRRFAVARFRIDGAHVDNVVLSDLHGRGIDAHTVLIIFFVLVEREILVDVLHVRRRLVGRSVSFAVGGRRVTVRIVDIFVTLEDRCALFVPVLPAEVVVLVAGGMLCNGIVNGRSHIGTNGTEVVGISSESAFFFRGQTIVAHVLSAARVA